ncbi:hypothetical protein Tco_0996544 [Tanacetum coccineum]
MTETMEQHMSKTRADYGSRVVRPKIEEKDSFELKGQFLKELRSNTFSGSDHEDANEHIEKVLEIVDLFHIPNITVDQVMLRAFPMSLTGSVSRWLRNKPTGSITTWEDLKAKTIDEVSSTLFNRGVVLFYNGLDVPTRQILDSRGAIPSMTAADAIKAIQEMAKYSQKWHNGTSRGRSTKTSDGLAAIQAQPNNLGREIKKVNVKVYAAQVGCEQCNGSHYTKDCLRKEEGKTLEEAYYTQFESAKRHEENSNLIKEIQASTDAAIRNQGASIKMLEIQIGQISKNNILSYKARQATIPFPSRLDSHYCDDDKGSYGPKFTEAIRASNVYDTIPQKEKDPGSFTLPCFINDVCFDNALVDLGASLSVMPLVTYLNLGLGELVHIKLTVELADITVKYSNGIAENVLVGIGKFTSPVDFIILDMPEDVKVPLILGRPFLSTAHAKIDIFKRKITLRVGEEKIIYKSVKPARSLIKRVYMLSLRERMELDLEARLMGETLVLNRSLDPILGDYIELNDLNVPLELRRNQDDDLMPTIEEGEVIEEFRTRDKDLDTGIEDYPSYCDQDKKIHIDCAHNLKFSCMIGFEFVYINFFLLLYVNVMSTKFHNSIMKDKMVYKGDNIVGALMNVPIFVGTFSVVMDFVILEHISAYRDKEMGDIIVGEPLLREVGINASRFDGMITIYNGNDEVSENAEMNGISHVYQKLKGFYQGVLNLGPDYIRDAKIK